MKELIRFDEETQLTFLKEVSSHQKRKSHMIKDLSTRELSKLTSHSTHCYQPRWQSLYLGDYRLNLRGLN